MRKIIFLGIAIVYIFAASLSWAQKPGLNLALDKPTQQSSLYSDGYEAKMGNDGRKDTFFHSRLESNPWWQVDLQGDYSLSYIMLYNRMDCCGERERTVRVMLSSDGTNWQTIYVHNGAPFQDLRVEAGGRRARFVRVQLAEQNYFHLTEVEVYGVENASSESISLPGTQRVHPVSPTDQLQSGAPDLPSRERTSG